MSFKKYDKYKDSEIDWLGLIPNNWSVVRVGDYTKQNKKKNHSLKESNLLSLSYGNIIRKNINTSIGLLPASFETYQIVDDGYMILRLTDLQNDKKSLRVGYVNEPGIITSAYLGLIFNKYTFSKYCYYLLHSFDIKKVFYSHGGSIRQSMKYDDFKTIPLLIPNYNEQIKIASYLDTKTQAIDKKITLLQQKIETYKELRKSIINQTVTKGLNKNVKLKKSGIKWIGEIPEHWEVKRFKEICYKNSTGGTPKTTSNEYFLGENIWITIADIGNKKYVENSNLKLTNEAIKEANISLTPKGSLLYSFKLTLGKIAFAKKELYTNEAIISILPNKNIDLEYFYFMLPILLLLQATENIYGAKMLNQKLIMNAILLNPPLSEQTQIANYLNKKTNKIDQITNNIQTTIEKLKELRKTLINDVVTGKIKVI